MKYRMVSFLYIGKKSVQVIRWVNYNLGKLSEVRLLTVLLFIHTVTSIKSTADDKRAPSLLAVCFRLAADTCAHGEGERGLPPLLACQLSPLHAAAERATPFPGVQECFPLSGRFLELYKRGYW
jgi:hypothetical protein